MLDEDNASLELSVISESDEASNRASSKNEPPSNRAGIGERVPRKEDQRLVTGRGCYSDDVSLPGQAYAYFLRSPHAHAGITKIDTAKAMAVPGVLTVLTGQDFVADGLKPIPHTPFSIHPAELQLPNTDGSPTFIAPHYPLCIDKVRYVGEAVAMVVAKTVALAKDAVEQIEVDYDVLPAVCDTTLAAAPDAPLLWPDAGSNVCVDAIVGDGDTTEATFARAAHTVSISTAVQRVTGVPMEPRAAVAVYDPAAARYTLYAGSGAPVRQKHDLAGVLGVPPEDVRVVMRDVGGNYGTRGGFYSEFALVTWAAKRTGLPVKWTCERHESFQTDYQGRDLHIQAELALDEDGKFLAMRGSVISNVGGQTVSFATLQKSVEVMSSIYDVAAVHFRARAVVSNTAPTRPYRATGRPEAMFVMERLIDLAVHKFGFDRLEIRRRNLIRPEALPYTNPFGMVYDNGLYQEAMNAALKLGKWDEFPKRKEEALKRGRYRGIGIANYVDTGTGVTRERTEITVRPDGNIDLVIGTMSNGQGHETSYAQLIVDWLGVPFEAVNLIAGDTDIVSFGGGSHSGRSMRLASIVIRTACDAVIAKAKKIAERLFEVSDRDLDFKDGYVSIKGTNMALNLFDIAIAASENQTLPDDLRGPLGAECDDIISVAAFPYGCHVCEVEVDPELGAVQLVGYAAVDDVGKAINPLIIDGQTHGGIAQGVGQALWEEITYDNDSGQLYAASFMDYAMPRADVLPSFETEISEVPASSHPLGIRPGGEGGTTPALAVVMNAIVDALRPFGVTHIEMPATPQRVWHAIQTARNNEASFDHGPAPS